MGKYCLVRIGVQLSPIAKGHPKRRPNQYEHALKSITLLSFSISHAMILSHGRKKDEKHDLAV